MKKWIYSLLVFFFVLYAVPPAAASAAGAGLAAAGQEVSVTLSMPEIESEAVTALRFRIQISVSTGSMGTPAFRFADSVPSSVKDAAVTVMENGDYIVDIILAGKKEQDIFKGSGRAFIGTLSLQPAAGKFRASVKIAPEAEDGAPVIRYVTGTGQSVQTAALSAFDTVTVTDTRPASDTSGSWVIPVYPDTPGTSGTGNTPVAPGADIAGPSAGGSSGASGTEDAPAVPDTDTPGPSAGETPDAAESFDKKTAPKLKVSVKSRTRRVTYQWTKTAGADAYQIYEYNEKTKKYTRIKTIFHPDKTQYSKNMEYGTAYTFRVRAFRTAADGSRIYGKLSVPVKVTTYPAKVQNLAAKRQNADKAVLTWQPLEKADGYQIFRSTKKNGAYTRIKTIPKGTAKKRSNISQKRGRVYYYKVRAYVAGADGKRRYGDFSSVKSAVCR